MKKFCLTLASLVILCSAILVAHLTAAAPETGGTLKDFFSRHGFGGAPLERRLGNQLTLSAMINGHRVGMLIDTGAPVTLIDKNSSQTLGLVVRNTTATAGGVFGKRWEKYAVSKLNSVSIGNGMITNVPVALADESDLNHYSRLGHIDGLFGAREMLKFGIVIDCARQELYVNPAGPSAASSQQLAGLLAGRGFTRIPLRRTGNKHFDVAGSINGHATRLIVDTGALTTLLGKEFAVQAGVVAGGFGGGRLAASQGGRRVPLSGGVVKELQIGDFKIPNAQVLLAPIDSTVLQSQVSSEANAGLLGEEYLSFNFAVIDIGGMALYLRHAD